MPKKFKMPRLTFGRFLLLLILAAAGYVAWLQFAPPQVVVQKPQTGKAVEAVYATGTVEAVESSRLGAVTSGRVLDVTVDIGDRVTKGQVLAQLDPDLAQQRLADAEARLRLAEDEYQRTRKLLARGFQSTQALQRAQTELQQARAAVDLNRKTLDDLTVRAPFDGYIIRREVDPGQSVGANAELFVLASTEKLRLVADVDERDIPRVRVGSAMLAKSDAFPEHAFTSQVSTIRQLGDTSTRTFRVEAPLPPDTPLMAGMTVDINIIQAERENALLVPFNALVRDTAQNSPSVSVWVVRDERARRQPVELGATGPVMVEVTSGLTAEDRVVLNPPAKLQDGQAVNSSTPKGSGA